MAVGSSKARRFLSRRLAEVNEGKLQSTSQRELDGDLQQALGAGISRRGETSETIKARTREAEQLRDSAKALYKSFAGAASSLGASVDSLRATRGAVAGFVEVFQDSPAQQADILKTSLSEVALIHDIMTNGLENLLRSMEINLVQQFQAYVKGDVRDARYFSHDFLKVQLEYEAAINRLNQLKMKPKVDAKRFYTAQQELNMITERFDLMADEALLRFNRLHEADTYRNASRVIEYLASLQTFFETGQRIFQELSPKLEVFRKEIARNLADTDDVAADAASTTSSTRRATMASDKTATALAMNDFAKLLTKPPLHVLAAVLETAPAEDVAPVAARMLHLRDVMPEVVRATVVAELPASPVTDTWTVPPLFSSGKPVPTLLAEYVRSALQPYVAHALRPTVLAVAKEKHVLELDPRSASFEQAEHATQRLSLHFRGAPPFRHSANVDRNTHADVTAAIFASRDVCPRPLRQMCIDVRAAVQDSARGDWRPIVCALLFGHVFLPALAAPDRYRLVGADALTPAAHRSLALLTAALRNMAHHQRADQTPSEAFLRTLDGIARDCWPALDTFIDAMSTPGPAAAWTADTPAAERLADAESALSSMCDEVYVVRLASTTEALHAKITAWLTQHSDTETFGALNTVLKTLRPTITKHRNAQAAQAAQAAADAAAVQTSMPGGTSPSSSPRFKRASTALRAVASSSSSAPAPAPVPAAPMPTPAPAASVARGTAGRLGRIIGNLPDLQGMFRRVPSETSGASFTTAAAGPAPPTRVPPARAQPGRSGKPASSTYSVVARPTATVPPPEVREHRSLSDSDLQEPS